jgi:hypothetical protein
MTKYHNRRITLDGYVFDSIAESKRYFELCVLQHHSEIHDLRVHPSYLLQPGFKVGVKPYQPITYVLDFSYMEGDQLVCEDVKGFATPEFRLKEKLFRFKYPAIVLRIVKV